MLKHEYIIKMSMVHEKEKLKEPRLKRPKPKIDIISIDTGSVFDEY